MGSSVLTGHHTYRRGSSDSNLHAAHAISVTTDGTVACIENAKHFAPVIHCRRIIRSPVLRDLELMGRERPHDVLDSLCDICLFGWV